MVNLTNEQMDFLKNSLDKAIPICTQSFSISKIVDKEKTIDTIRHKLRIIDETSKVLNRVDDKLYSVISIFKENKENIEYCGLVTAIDMKNERIETLIQTGSGYLVDVYPNLKFKYNDTTESFELKLIEG